MENRPPKRVEASPLRVEAITDAMMRAGNAKCRELHGSLVDSATATLHLAQAAFRTLLQHSEPEMVEMNRLSIQESILKLFHDFDGPEDARRPS
jgi:hypothetical protein